MSISPLISAYDHVILDLDGTVWIAGVSTRRAADAIAAIRDSGRGIMFVTNDGDHSPEDFVRRLAAIGATAFPHEIVSVGAAIEDRLAQREAGAGVYVIGTEAVHGHVLGAGHRVLNGTPEAEHADYVVSVLCPEFSYEQMVIATRALLDGAELITGGRDRTFPAATGIDPGTGALTAALEFATGVRALEAGKPDPQIFEVALHRLGGGRALVIGDNLGADLAGAAAAGLDAAVVLTGLATRQSAEAAHDPAPVAIGADLAALVLSQ